MFITNKQTAQIHYKMQHGQYHLLQKSHPPLCSGETVLTIQFKSLEPSIWQMVFFLFFFGMSRNLPALPLRSTGDCDRPAIAVDAPLPYLMRMTTWDLLKGVSNLLSLELSCEGDAVTAVI